MPVRISDKMKKRFQKALMRKALLLNLLLNSKQKVRQKVLKKWKSLTSSSRSKQWLRAPGLTELFG